MRELREAFNLEAGLPDDEVIARVIETHKAVIELATQQAGELARKDAAFDRISAAAADGLHSNLAGKKLPGS